MKKGGEIGILIVKELTILNKSGFGVLSYVLSLVFSYYYSISAYVIYNLFVIFLPRLNSKGF